MKYIFMLSVIVLSLSLCCDGQRSTDRLSMSDPVLKKCVEQQRGIEQAVGFRMSVGSEYELLSNCMNAQALAQSRALCSCPAKE